MCSGLETCIHWTNIYKDTMIQWTTDKLMCSGLETCSQYLQRHNDTLDYW